MTTALLRARARFEQERRAGEHELARWIPARTRYRRVDPALLPVCRLWDRIRRGEQVFAVIAQPPRSYKTTTCFAGAVREMELRPGFRYGYATYNISESRVRSSEMRELAAEAGLWVGRDETVALKGIPNSSLTLWSAGAAGRSASRARFMGAGGGGIGAGLDLLHIDDPIKNEDEANSGSILDRRWAWIAGTMFSRLEPHASVIISHHRWSEEDPIGRILAQVENRFADLPDDVRALLGDKVWEVITIPAYYPGPGEPEPEDWRDIDMAKAVPALSDWQSMRQLAVVRAQSEDAFGAKFMQRPPTSSLRLFPDRFPTWEPEREGGYETGVTVRGEWIPVPRLRGKFHVLGVDTAGSEALSADWTAVVWAAFWYEEDPEYGVPALHGDVIHCWLERLEPTAVVDHVAKIALELGDVTVAYERQAEGRATLAFLQRDYPRVRVYPMTTSASKRVRATPAGNASKRGHVRLPAEAPWLGEWRSQVCRFTGYGQSSASVKDDLADAFAHAYNLAALRAQPFTPLSGGASTLVASLGFRPA